MREIDETYTYYINIYFNIYIKYVENSSKKKFDIDGIVKNKNNKRSAGAAKTLKKFLFTSNISTAFYTCKLNSRTISTII
jgi:hypothetical protein